MTTLVIISLVNANLIYPEISGCVWEPYSSERISKASSNADRFAIANDFINSSWLTPDVRNSIELKCLVEVFDNQTSAEGFVTFGWI